ncbi:MAG: hypothetical protein OHK0046_35620 [Anaerolineae bacterium]
MQIKRDYTQPLFTGTRKPKRNYARILFFFGMMIGAVLVYVAANFETLQEDALEMVGMSPTATPLPSDLATIAANLVIQGELQQAADLFSAAIEQRPDNIDYLYEYGQLLIDMGDYSTPLELGDRILQVNPDEARGYALKARALVWAGNPTAAVPVAIAGLDIRPGYAPLYSMLARAYSDSGQYADGVEAGLRAIEADPEDVDSRRSYAHTLSYVGDSAEATRQLEIALMMDTNKIATYFELAFFYLAQNRDQEAIDLYDRVLAIQPRNARAMLRLCEAYRKVGQFQRAVGYCQDATETDPTYTDAFFQLGLLLYNDTSDSQNFTRARNAFARCSELNPDSLNCKYRLGLSYHYMGDCDNAWTILQEALVMAQGRALSAAVETATTHITEGLNAVGQSCPQYGRILPTTPPEVTPEVGSEA